MADHSPALAQDPLVDVRNPDHMRIGTLTYTKGGLVTLFAFLLWGDFCWCLMESVTPSVLTLKFNAIGASNWVLGLLMTTIPKMVETVVNPTVSFLSDRYRSKWGRRIPFLMGVTPFLVVLLTLMGFSDDIGTWVHRVALKGKYSDATVMIATLGVFLVCFQFFNSFTTSIYYYLFNDTVPHAFLARFLSLFRIASGVAGTCYSYFVLPFAGTHMKEIFLGAAVVYCIGFTTMCWGVKEGQYPPPSKFVGGQSGILAGIKTYASECFTHRFYWLIFLVGASEGMIWVGYGFGLLQATNYLHFSLEFVGEVTGTCGIISLFLNYPAGVIADRFHPVRMLLVVKTIGLLLAPLTLAYIFIWHPRISPQASQHIWIALNGIGLPLGAIAGAAGIPMLMKLFPKDRFGQFCSANAMVRAAAMIVGGVSCGWVLDASKVFNPDPNYCYRFLSYWDVATNFSYVFFLCLVQREWKRLGGLAKFEPPRAGFQTA